MGREQGMWAASVDQKGPDSSELCAHGREFREGSKRKNKGKKPWESSKQGKPDV